MSTIEMTNTNILHNCSLLTATIPTLLKKYKASILNFSELEKKIHALYQKSENLSQDYNLGSVIILNEFFSLNNPSENIQNDILPITRNINSEIEYNKRRSKCLINYNEFIQEENIIGKLNDLFAEYNHIISLLKTSKDSKVGLSREFKKIIYKYNDSPIRYNNVLILHEMCDSCKCKMSILANTSEIQCNKCGMTKELSGTIFEDDQYYYQDNQKSKHGSYDPTKHCKFWIRRIQAREYIDVDETVLNQVKQYLKRDKIICKCKITCDKIREYLRETKNSHYNEYVPLIRKIITGISPPQLSECELQSINNYFNKVIRIFEEIKPFKKINCPYHPYFIYKIIEQVIHPPRGGHDHKKQEILSCIHLQSRDTLIENDRIWKLICEKIPNFIYIPTDRTNREIDY